MIIQNHLLQDVAYFASPNCADRPADMPVDLIVLHNISLPPNQFGGPYITDLFLNKLDINAHPFFATISHLKVASHLLLNREGVITQYVPFNKAAYHAGASNYQGRPNCNDFSIGIEIEGTDDVAYEDIQYKTLAELTKTLIAYYPSLSTEHITGHSDIAPSRKTDPGPAFDWDFYRSLI